MFSHLYEWIQNIAFYLVLVTAVTQVLPDTAYKKYIRFFTGLVLILLLAAPILKLFGMERTLTEVYQSDVYEQEIEKIEGSTEYLEELDVSEWFSDAGVAREEDAEDANHIEVEEIDIGE